MNCKLAKQEQRMLEKKADRYMDMVDNLEPYLSERSFNEKLVQELVDMWKYIKWEHSCMFRNVMINSSR